MAPKRKHTVARRGRFPARAVLLDACALIRLHKAEALHLLADTIEFAAAEHAYGEFAVGGPSARAALARLAVVKRPLVPGSPEWKHFTLVRQEFSTVDLGEDQSIAVALAEIDRGNPTPIVTYDDCAEKKARGLGVPTVSFLATLAWLISCDRLSIQAAEELEERAAARDGWKRPASHAGPLAGQMKALCDALAPAVEAAKKRKRTRRR